MSDYLFALLDAGGAVPPVLSVAGALSERGHDVRVLTDPVVRAEVEASLRQREATAAFRALLDELREKADVRVDEGTLARLSESADAGVTSERPQGRSLRR